MRAFFLIISFMFSWTLGIAQNITIRPENRNDTLSLWAQNNFPCPLTLSASPTKMDSTFKAYIPAQKERIIFQTHDPDENLFEELTETIDYQFVMGNPNAIHHDDYQYSLPFPEGESYMLTQGNKTDFTHNDRISNYAFDFSMPEGSLISAARGGVVGFVQEKNTEGGNDIKLMHNSNYIIVCHDDDTIAAYAHLQYDGAIVEVGDQVFAGQVIGFSGNTGFTTSPHLHFSVLIADRSIPIRFRNEYTILYEGEVYFNK